VRIISRRRLREFEALHPPARPGLQLWYHTARSRTWSSPADIKQDYANASIIAGNRVVFNIGGNSYRLVVKFNYGYGVGDIRFVGTHAEYDKIDAAKV
jgi:mRNA interferase HigB